MCDNKAIAINMVLIFNSRSVSYIQYNTKTGFIKNKAIH